MVLLDPEGNEFGASKPVAADARRSRYPIVHRQRPRNRLPRRRFQARHCASAVVPSRLVVSVTEPRGVPSLRQVVLDTTDARGLAEFWRQLLDLAYRPGDEPPAADADDPRGRDWLVLHLRDDASKGGVALAVQQVEAQPASTWPDPAVPQQLHLDLTVPDVAAHPLVEGRGEWDEVQPDDDGDQGGPARTRHRAKRDGPHGKAPTEPPCRDSPRPCAAVERAAPSGEESPADNTTPPIRTMRFPQRRGSTATEGSPTSGPSRRAAAGYADCSADLSLVRRLTEVIAGFRSSCRRAG